MRRLARATLLAIALAGRAGADSAEQLEARAKAFYDLVERGQKDRAIAVWPDLERDLAAKVESLDEQLGMLREDLMERDGDVDALHRSPAWRDLEIPSLVLSYHLAWVRYQAAQLVPDAPRKRTLLEDAIDGFSKFAVVSEVPEIHAESLYGRGLAYMDLGDRSRARRDFEAAAKEKRTAAKARAALAELARGGGKGAPATPPPAPPENDPDSLLARLPDVVRSASHGNPGHEKTATDLARGLTARGGTWPSRVERAVCEATGATAPADVRSSFGLALLAQLAVDRGRCAEVPPLVAAGASARDATRARHRPELLFIDAGCKLNAGKAREAADAFGTLLAEHPDAARAREAAYYRFRALDLVRSTDPGATDDYEHALGLYLERFSRTDAANEARFLLGELHRARGDCANASAAYEAVGPGPFAARARLAAIECRVGRLDGTAGTPDRAAVLADLRAFVRDTPAKGDAAPLVARAALVGGLVAATAKPPDHTAVVDVLADFETRYPDATNLHARAVETRLKARVALGQLEAAAVDMDRFLAGAGAAETTVLRQLGRDLAERAGRGTAPATEPALALARKVYARVISAGEAVDDRLALAALELRAGGAVAARAQYDAVLARDPGSGEALRGAARAAALAGDRAGAMRYWRQIVESSAPGGTSWYEARLAQVELLATDGQQHAACDLARQSRGRSTTTGGDALAKRLAALEPTVCP